jgi:hypothetical protein
MYTRIEAPVSLAPRIEAAARVLQCRERPVDADCFAALAAEAFPDDPHPGWGDGVLARGAAEAAACPECEEAVSVFGRDGWKNVSKRGASLPRYFGGLQLLRPDAREFYFPAYLVAAVRHHDADLLYAALDAVPNTKWTTLQRALIDTALRLAQGSGC